MLFLKNMSRVLGMFAFSLTVISSINRSILRTFCLRPCPHSNYSVYYIEVLHPHQQYFGDFVSNFGFLPDMKSTYGNHGKEKCGNSWGNMYKCDEPV